MRLYVTPASPWVRRVRICILELGIAVFGLVAMWMVPALGSAYTSWAGEGTTSLALRALVASICLIPPTLLMGATLPVVARGVEATPDGVAWLGYFYGGNYRYQRLSDYWTDGKYQRRFLDRLIWDWI